MYYIVFFLLLFFCIVEIYKERINPVWFNFIYLMMTCMVMFRYGQLTDYFNYKLAYEEPEKVTFVDPLYFSIKELFQYVGFNYEGYVMIEGAISMGLAYPFFSKLCKKSITSLLVFYCYAFLVYPMSAARQGLCISLLLFGFYHLMKGRKILFIALIVIFTFVHLSFISSIIILYVYKKDWFNNDKILWVWLFLTIFAIFSPDITYLIPAMFVDRVYSAESEGKFLPMLVRIMVVVPLLIFKPKHGTMGYYAKAICISGYFIYCIFSFSPLTAGRLEAYYRVFLSLFVSYAIFSIKVTGIRMRLILFLLFFHFVLFFKNLGAAIDQADYEKDKVSIWNFPYISVFNKDEYREYNYN